MSSPTDDKPIHPMTIAELAAIRDEHLDKAKKCKDERGQMHALIIALLAELDMEVDELIHLEKSRQQFTR